MNLMNLMRNPMTWTIDWEALYGPIDGPWLQAEFEHVSSGLDQVENIRVARLDDETEMTRYHQQADEGAGVAGDWELISPETGGRYMMGCNWRD